jgi:hypothetical protein
MGAYRGIGGGSGCTSTGTCFLHSPCSIYISYSLRPVFGFHFGESWPRLLVMAEPDDDFGNGGRTNLGRLSR